MFDKKTTNIYFWFDKRPFASEGVLKEFSNKININVYFFSRYLKDDDRSGINSHNVLESLPIIDNSIEKTLHFYGLPFENTIHIVNGFFSPVLNELNKLEKQYQIEVVCLTEPVSMMSRIPLLETVLKKIKYNKQKRNLNGLIKKTIFFGEDGIDFFKAIHWSFDSVWTSYMPYIKEYKKPIDRCKITKSGLYVYIGRNKLYHKGLGNIIKYFKSHPLCKLLIIGNYGDDSNTVKNIISGCKNISLIEAKPFSELYSYIFSNNIKCILTPSAVDGCNVNNYLGIITGTPVITTFNSRNYSIIKESNSGMIIKYGYRELAKAIDLFEAMESSKLKFLSQNAFNFLEHFNCSSEAEKILAFITDGKYQYEEN